MIQIMKEINIRNQIDRNNMIIFQLLFNNLLPKDQEIMHIT
jgi:hypothetical protein